MTFQANDGAHTIKHMNVDSWIDLKVCSDAKWILEAVWLHPKAMYRQEQMQPGNGSFLLP